MHICVVTHSVESKDGWGTYSRGLTEGLRSRGHQVAVVCQKGGEHAVLSSPISVLVNPIALLGSAWRLRKLLTTLKPDIVHFAVEPYGLLLPFLNAEKSVLTLHGSYGVRIFERWFTRVLAKKAMKQFSKIITVSNYTKERVEPLLGSAAKKVVVVKNGVDVSSLERPRDDNRSHSDTKHILLVGGVKPRKGVKEAIAACKVFKERYGTPFRFTVVGAKVEPYASEMQTAVISLQLSAEVEFTGVVSDEELEQLYAKADLLLLPAHTSPNTFEGFGLVYIEAAARGIPCIGPNDSGAAEAIDEGVSGYKCDPEDADQIAEKMDAILNQSAISSENCRLWAEKHKIADRIAEIEGVYVSI